MKKLDQRGVVSLLSVVIFSIIITVVVTLYARLAVTQQKDSVTYDLGTRAYYGAISGIQDAVRGLNSSATLRQDGKDGCTPLVDGSGSSTGRLGDSGRDYGVEYTCQLIDTEPDYLEGQVGQSQNVTLALRPRTVPPSTRYAVRIYWSPVRNDGTNLTAPRPAGQAFTSVTNWRQSASTAYNPVLRTSLIGQPLSTSTRNTIAERTFFLYPGQYAGSAAHSVVYSGVTEGTRASEENLLSTCSATPLSVNYNGYACRRTLLLPVGYLTSNDLYLRLGSVYGTTQFRIELLTNTTSETGGTIVPIANTQAVIDVTATVGGTYRRVAQPFSLNNRYLVDNNPEAAVIGGDGICKNFTLGPNAGQYSERCDPLSPRYIR